MAPIDTTNPSLTIVKQFPYRGALQEWSNTYFFTGPTPSDAAAWKALADDVIADERHLYDNQCEVVRAVGHEAGETIAVWGYDYAAAGEEVAGDLTLSATCIRQSGDTANWLRWATAERTDKGKPIYLRNYYHPAFVDGTTEAAADQVSPTWSANAETFGGDWVTGYTVDGVERFRTGPHGATGFNPQSCAFATTRTLKRRGRRP